jgi:hypothetical protein
MNKGEKVMSKKVDLQEVYSTLEYLALCDGVPGVAEWIRDNLQKEYQVTLKYDPEKKKWPNTCHESHKSVRSSDASTFDFICDDCAATDDVTGGWGTLRKPCKVTK